MNIKFSKKYRGVLAIGLLIATGSCYAESIDQLADRVGMKKYFVAIRAGDRNAFAKLPAKGYSNGLAGLMSKYNVYPNPEYSFADCTDEAVLIRGPGGLFAKPGCRVSIKLATKDFSGKFQDNGIRIEYAIGLGQKQFSANNSVYAEYAISRPEILEGSLMR